MEANFKIVIAGESGYITCTKFKAMECFQFITKIIKLLPEKHEVNFLSRNMAEAIIMRAMDTGIETPLDADQKKELKKMAIDDDYFVLLFRTAFINANEYEQEELTNQLLKLYVYNGNQIDVEAKSILFSDMRSLFNALAHVIRYNYNDFFIIDER
jgi:hypothetical protein